MRLYMPVYIYYYHFIPFEGRIVMGIVFHYRAQLYT